MQSDNGRWDSFTFSTTEKKSNSPNYIYEPFSPEQFKKRSASGKFKQKDPNTNQIIQQGQFQYGKPVGQWIQYDQDGDKKIFKHESYRVGALCRDGSMSSATGRGACSWHGGVAQWLYQTQKVFVQGTGKYEPIQNRLRKVRDEGIKLFGFQNIHNKEQLQYNLYKEAIRLKKQSNMSPSSVKKQQNLIKKYEEQINSDKTQIAELKMQIDELKEQLQEQDEKIQKAKQNQKLYKEKDQQIIKLREELRRKLIQENKNQKIKKQIQQKSKQKQKKNQDNLQVNVKKDNKSYVFNISLELNKQMLEKSEEKQQIKISSSLCSSLKYPSLPQYQKEKSQDTKITVQHNVFSFSNINFLQQSRNNQQKQQNPQLQVKEKVKKQTNLQKLQNSQQGDTQNINNQTQISNQINQSLTVIFQDQ